MKQIEMIINKMPNYIKDMFDTPFITQEDWTPEWNDWAQKALLECTKARDEGIITKLEWQLIRKKIFNKLGGIIGERPFCNNLAFMDFLYYDKGEEHENICENNHNI